MSQPTYALTEDELQALEGAHGNAKTGAHMDVERYLPIDLAELRAADRFELAEYAQTVVDYAGHIAERYMGIKSAQASEVVAICGRVRADLTEVAALMRSDSLPPRTEWLPGKYRAGLTQAEADKLRDELARTTYRNLTQMKIVHSKEDGLDLLDEKGRPNYWALVGLTRLMRETRHLLERWCRLLSWYDVSAPTLSVEDEILTLIQEEQGGTPN